MLEIDPVKFAEVRKRAEEEYSAISKVRCPYLNMEVSFSREGFEHLLFKSWNRTRSMVEQYIRLKLIRLAPQVVQKSHTLQEYKEQKLMVRQKLKSGWGSRMRLVRYYVFVAIINEARIKVIVKEIEGGKPFFYSLYPSWKIEVDVNGQKRKKFFSGNPETD